MVQSAAYCNLASDIIEVPEVPQDNHSVFKSSSEHDHVPTSRHLDHHQVADTADANPFPIPRWHITLAAYPLATGIVDAAAAWSEGSNDAGLPHNSSSTSCGGLNIEADQAGDAWGNSASDNDGTQDVQPTGNDAELAWDSLGSVAFDIVGWSHDAQLENADAMANTWFSEGEGCDLSEGANAAANAWLSHSNEGMSTQGLADTAANVWMSDANTNDDTDADADDKAATTVFPSWITLPHIYSGANFTFLDESWFSADFNFKEEESDGEDSSDQVSSDDEDDSSE